MAPAGTFTIRDFRVGSDYLVPDLVGLTVAQARDEWSHRYGYRVNTVGRPDNADYRAVTSVITWAGFTGAVDVGGVLNAEAELVASFTTTPAGGVAGQPLAATAALHITVALSPG